AIQPLAHDVLREADLVFLALPDTAAAEIAPALAGAGVRVIDLSGAFRLRDQDLRARWYPDTRHVPARVAYGLTERERPAVHGAEIEQGLGRDVTFTPHLVPLDRGILSTIYVRVPAGTTEAAVGDVLSHAYASDTFVRLTGSALPEIKHVAHTNFCDIGWRVD